MAQEISVQIGRNEEGAPYNLMLTQSPHVLIGGTTGSGKSTLIHSILTSLIAEQKQNELRLYIGDPKRIEFSRYADAPHVDMVAQTVEDHVRMLERLVHIMETRYDLLQQCVDENGIRVQGVYHSMIMHETDAGFRQFRFPNIVVVIDELGSLAMDRNHGKSIVDALVLLTQLGRAAGINLVLATQNPIAKVFDSRIKSNCPTRISLKVSTKTNSRVILDCGGAELLEGTGDALIVSPYTKDKSKIKCTKLDCEYIDLQIQLAMRKQTSRTHQILPKNNRKLDVSTVSTDCRVFDFGHLKSLRAMSAGSRHISPN